MMFIIGFMCLILGIFASCASNRFSAWVFIGIAVIFMGFGQWITILISQGN